jgi:hypothetical protein
MRQLRRPMTMLLMATLLAGAAISLRASAPELELTVIARDMAFYLEGDPTPNPTIRLERGRRVRILFINEDRGMQHDLLLPDLGLATKLLPGDGSRATLTFRTPKEALDSRYACTPHMAMMTAALEIY